jgi:hypothetical protein
MSFFVCFGGQQDPKSVDAKRGSERDVEEERREREHYGNRARPAVSLEQTSARGKSYKSFYHYDGSCKAQQWMRECGSIWMCGLVENDTRYEILGDPHQAIEGGRSQPEDSEKPNMLPNAVGLRISSISPETSFPHRLQKH